MYTEGKRKEEITAYKGIKALNTEKKQEYTENFQGRHHIQTN